MRAKKRFPPQADVLDGGQKFPQGRDRRKLAQAGQGEVNGHHDEVGGQDAQRPTGIETSETDLPLGRQMAEELATDQVAAQHEEEVHADPPEAVNLVGQHEAKGPGVVEDDDDDGLAGRRVEGP